MTMLVLSGLALALSWHVLMRKTSDPRRLECSSNRVLAHFLEIGLYKDQPRQIGACLLDLWWAAWRLARALLWPCLLFLIPLAMVGTLLYQADSRPLQVGEEVLLRAPLAKLTLPPEVTLEAGPVEAEGVAFWRLRPKTAGLHRLQLGETTLELQVGGLWLAPGSSPILYPQRTLWVGSHQLHWAWFVLVPFLFGAAILDKAFRLAAGRRSLDR